MTQYKVSQGIRIKWSLIALNQVNSEDFGGSLQLL